MKKLLLVFSLSAMFAQADFVADTLQRSVLPGGAGVSSFATVFNEVEAADADADYAWCDLESQDQYHAYRKKMHSAYVTAIGGFPQKTDLKAQVITRIERPSFTENGVTYPAYRVEKILFESRPGEYLTAVLYLPNAEKFKPPYATFLVTCGHSGYGKGEEDYARACVMGVRVGLASLIYDPIGQGERNQEPPTANCDGHNRYGVLAMLLGQSTARQRIWDGMRCMDYLDTREDIRHDGYGYMGNSGGGTMTALIEAIDPLVKVAAPSCYLSSLREVAMHDGPQDAEQNIFGQLSFGLNHAGYVLLGNNAIRMHCCHSDFFPFEGSRETYRVVQSTIKHCGLDSARYGLTDLPGPHGWKESTRTSSILWMQRWLLGDTSIKIDVPACREKDITYNWRNVDCGLDHLNHQIAPKGDIRNLKGFRSVYEDLKDELTVAESKRKPITSDSLRTWARLGKTKFQVTQAWQMDSSNVTAVAYAFSADNGLRLPTIVYTPKGAVRGCTLVLNDSGRKPMAEQISKELASGKVVMVADTLATGEIGTCKHHFYSAKNGDEEVAVMLYWLGKSLVGVRTEEIIAFAQFLKQQTKQPVTLLAKGRLAIPAAHAFAAEPTLFADVQTITPPLSWSDAVRKSAVYAYANAIHGALLKYDWVDLLPKAK